MTNQDLVQFHSSQQSLAGEIAYRKTMRDAGFSEGEIDGMILKAYLRGRFYRTWGSHRYRSDCRRCLFGLGDRRLLGSASRHGDRRRVCGHQVRQQSRRTARALGSRERDNLDWGVAASLIGRQSVPRAARSVKLIESQNGASTNTAARVKPASPGFKPPVSTSQPAAASGRAGSNSRKCGSPLPSAFSKRSRAFAVTGARAGGAPSRG